MRLVLLGPPGAGKGTLALVLAKELAVPHISTGDMLREALRTASSLGLKAKEYMDKGSLVPDDLVIALVRERLEMPDAKKGFILDGFPRTPEQAKDLDDELHDLSMPLGAVLYFKTSLEVIIRRLSGRRICGQCGKTYHTTTYRAKVAGICDVCQGTLVQRPDDHENVVTKRLQTYEQQTAPLIDYYRKLNLLEEISGDLEVVDIMIILDKIFKKRGLAAGSGIKN